MRRLILVASVAGAALAVAVVAAATTGAQGTAPPSGTLELVLPEEGSRFRFVDNPPLRRESAGDMAVVTGRLTDATGARAGRLQAYFLATTSGDFDRRFRGQAAGTLMLAGGDIVLEGVTDDTREPEFLAIAGGTGQYAGARGTVAVTEAGNQTRFLVTFMP
jgi:hypothetical protein